MVAIEARRGEGTGQHGGASSAVEASNARESTQTLLAVIILICGGGTTVKNVDGHRSLPSVIIGGGWPPLSIRHLFYFLLILPPWRMSNGASTLSSGFLSAFFLALYRSTTRRREVQG